MGIKCSGSEAALSLSHNSLASTSHMAPLKGKGTKKCHAINSQREEPENVGKQHALPPQRHHSSSQIVSVLITLHFHFPKLTSVCLVWIIGRAYSLASNLSFPNRSLSHSLIQPLLSSCFKCPPAIRIILLKHRQEYTTTFIQAHNSSHHPEMKPWCLDRLRE